MFLYITNCTTKKLIVYKKNYHTIYKYKDQEQDL